ncbi:MAG: serine hydrolase [Bacteroidia bacterium]|nr:serine hydrolase [Bacteroidia bacterium]
MKFYFLIITFLLWPAVDDRNTDPNEAAKEAWVEKTFNQLSFEEKLGQLFMLRAYSNRGGEHKEEIKQLIQEYHIGGLCFFQGDPETQARYTNEYQALSKVPLWLSIDAEWGIGMRMKYSTISYPRQLMLGAIQDDELIYEMGVDIGKQLKRLGVHVNFAPVVDVNNNAANPVINTRSFGEDKYNVTAKSYMYMKGLQDAGVLACAKHFPGHGDTDVDSHYDLPVITHNKTRLDSIELYPFRVLANKGIGSMMIAHLQVPAIDETENLPTTLSPKAVTELLRNELNYQGITFTDALDMKGVTKHHESGEVEAKALLAGNDVLLLPEDMEAAFDRIGTYLESGILDTATIYNRVKKILRAKYDLGLGNYAPVQISSILDDLNNPKSIVLKRKLIQNALTLVRNDNKTIPIHDVQQKIASVAIGSNDVNTFQQSLSRYTRVEHFNIGHDASESDQTNLLKALETYNLVILSVHDLSSYATKDFGLSEIDRALISKITDSNKSIFVHFGNPYALKYFEDVDAILQAYEESDDVMDITAQVLFGAVDISGRLPVTASETFQFGQGIQSPSIKRLTYGLPESVGMSSDSLSEIRDIFEHAIDTAATPGGVVLVARRGKVVYEEAFGFHTYAKQQPVRITDLYDLASVTKTSAATTSVMKLVEEGKVDLDKPLKTYIPSAQGTTKGDLTLREIMTHHSGLKPWIPFYKQTVKGNERRAKPDAKWYRSKSDEEFNIEVADGLYMRSDFRDSIWQQIYEAEMRPNKNYRYSDLGFYMIAELISKQVGNPLDEYVEEQFCTPLGMCSTTYNPHEKYDKNQIVPTEEDQYFRDTKVHGFVHDMGAAQLGGVSGHAGLFSTANDLAILYQMLLNQGHYGGEDYLTPETIRTFTTRYEGSSRRGIGFDMKELDTLRSQNVSDLVSEETFGHLGFTGTCVWVDPKEDLVIVVLANRTYPSMHNNKWGDMNVRPQIQSAIYKSILQKASFSALRNSD